jgi:hypothetical protein
VQPLGQGVGIGGGVEECQRQIHRWGEPWQAKTIPTLPVQDPGRV